MTDWTPCPACTDPAHCGSWSTCMRGFSQAEKATDVNLRGIKVHRIADIIFIPLPPEAAKVIEFGCQCNYCKAHPDTQPRWDTLAVRAEARTGEYDSTWIVHFPELKER